MDRNGSDGLIHAWTLISSGYKEYWSNLFEAEAERDIFNVMKNK